MANFLLFSGSADGKKLVERLLQGGAEVCVSADSGYVSCFPAETPVLKEPAEAEALATLLQSLQFDCVIDASYRGLDERSEQRKAACAFSDIRYLRLVRSPCTGEECVHVDSSEKAVGVLSATTGKALLTIGMRDLDVFTGVPDFQDRLYLRVKPSPAVIDQCLSMGYRQSNIIAMEGPFSREINCAMLRQIGATLLVTRAAEESGGVMEKLLAAQDVGATAILVGRIREDRGLTYPELLELLESDYGIKNSPRESGVTYFPLFVDLHEKKLVVFGGGLAAAKRTETLLRFGQHVSVVAPQFDAAFDQLEAVRIERPYMRGDCTGYDYVFAVTDNREINYAVCEEARAAGIPSYAEDAPEESDFAFPEITRKGAVVVGACIPERDKKLGQSLVQAIGERLETLLIKKKPSDELKNER